MFKHLFLAAGLLISCPAVFAGGPRIAPPQGEDTIDLGPQIRKQNLPVTGEISSADQVRARSMTSRGYYQVGAVVKWLALDNYKGVNFWADFELRALGEKFEIWVQKDLAWPTGDPRPVPVITDAQVSYMMKEFEGNIYGKNLEYFGNPTVRDGSKGSYPAIHGGSDRIIMLVSNVRDEKYYNDAYPYYVAGFFSPSFRRIFDRNIVTIDAFDWENRVGPDAKRPYQYEATLAHEFQHLIHRDLNPDDPSFMNEGCSLFSEVVCGYGVDWPKVNSFLATPDNSLVEWEDQGGINTLADYGASLLWTLYLNDHFGGPQFITHFVKAGIPDIAGINSAFAHFGYDMTFDTAVKDWQLANLIHSDHPGAGKYNYKTVDLNSSASTGLRIYSLNDKVISNKTGVSFGPTTTNIGNNTGIYTVGTYGADYIKLTRAKEESIFLFNGDDSLVVPTWKKVDQDQDGDQEWYSTVGAPEQDLKILAKVNLAGMGNNPVLTFDTLYDIEPLWDFAFVQISADGGQTWTSLANSSTTVDHDPGAYPAIVANLPGLTGASNGWVNMSFDLSAFAGKNVIVAFRYMTDWGTENAGIYVDNIQVNGTVIDNADAVNAVYFPVPPEADFNVTLIPAKYRNGYPVFTQPKFLKLDDVLETGRRKLGEMMEDADELHLIISPTKGSGDYAFSLHSSDN